MDASDFPRHEAGLTLEHNPHKALYESLASYTSTYTDEEWVSSDQAAKALETGSLWVLQWYPDTPVGSCLLAAADLDALLQAAKAADE